MKICPICKKEFDISGYQKWIYKRRLNYENTYYCSWTCLNKVRKKTTTKKVKENKTNTISKKSRIRAVINLKTNKVYPNMKEATKETGVSTYKIYKYQGIEWKFLN